MNPKTQSTILRSLLVLLLITTSVIFVISLVNTNPTSLGPGGVTFWFINVLLLVSSAVSISSYAIASKRAKYSGNILQSLYSSIRTGFLVGFSVTILLALSSLRSLSWRDIILFLLTIALVEIYFRTRRTNS